MEKELIEAAGILVNKLIECGKKVSVAESCTGGLISAAITSIPGASNIIELGVCTYSVDQKVRLLGVKKETVEKFDVVSEETVKEMVSGIQILSGSYYAISTSGYAGPQGNGVIPVGTVCIGIKAGKNVSSYTIHCNGDRQQVRISSALFAIKTLISKIDEE